MDSVADHYVSAPDESRLREVARIISPYTVRTPTVPWPAALRNGNKAPSEVFVKLELLQRTGSFKARGAVNTIWHLLQSYSDAGGDTRFPGVTAFSAGNHAIATAYAAQCLGTSAKVVMPRTADPFRRAQCASFGAELMFGESISDLLSIVKSIQMEEGRLLVHPFEGVHIAEGTATVGLELCDDTPELDAVIVPVGGGGLMAGVASAVKQLQPECLVFGVEPEGANGMQQSLLKQAPMESVTVTTIADSLGAPMHAPISFGLISEYVDGLVTVTDDEMKESMRILFADMKLAVEPACAASLAALLGPLTEQLAGKRVALIGCGSNIDLARYCQLVSE